MDKFPRIAVRAIISNDEGKVLITQRTQTKYAPGCWELPGGKLEHGETLEYALTQEVLEETKIQISDIQFFSYLEGIPEKKSLPHFITFIFTCHGSGDVVLGEEVADYRWIGKEELKEYAMAFRLDEVLEKVWKI